MADGDGGFLDPRGDTPVGSAYPMGNIDPNNELYDWASRLQPDDLAKFLHDPQGTAQEFQARGLPPPPMDAIHDHNEQMGTPSRGDRLQQAQTPDPLAGPYRVDPQTGRLMNLTSDQNQPAPTPRPRPAGAGGGRRGLNLGYDPAEDTGPPVGSGPGGPVTPPDPNSPIQRFNRWRNPNVAAPSSPEAPGAPAVPLPPGAAKVTVNKESPPAAAPPPGSDLNPPPPAEQPKISAEAKKPDEKKPKTKMEEVGDALSDLGKAMQGVKAPEPLKPPSSFAPAPHGPTAGQNIGALLAALGQARAGQVPPSAMPVLRMLGR
jgi:hypothetical protein